jgi:uncharacterized protein YyaL (SSP411 family)
VKCVAEDVTFDFYSSSPIPGFLDDYAFVIRGLLDLYESCFDPSWIEWAEVLQDQQDRLFWDDEDAGYFTSPASDASILIRLKEGKFVSCCMSEQMSRVLAKNENCSYLKHVV